MYKCLNGLKTVLLKLGLQVSDIQFILYFEFIVMGFMSTSQKETIVYTILLYEVRICLIETVATIFNIMNANRYQILFIQARRFFIESDRILCFFCARKNILTPPKR